MASSSSSSSSFPLHAGGRATTLPRPAASLPHLVLLLAAVGVLQAHALPTDPAFSASKDDEPKPADDPGLWAYLGTAVALVLLGGAFAGLTIALMGQDEIYLQVIATSGEGSERKNAAKVLRLLQKGKHWVLVTLLLSNVITNETLPIVLDRSLGGGWPAVLSSTVLIVIFGEIVPQSVCVRYGLPIGAFMAPMVLCLMWIMAPVAWPTAKLLDKLLGEDHGTMYKKAGLKTLVTLHRTLGQRPDERLNQDEVTIISAVLDLKDKPVGSIMTPMNDVFTLSANAVLDEPMMEMILSAGYSRIPIYEPENPRNFVGMLLIKMLITYDPEDCLRVRDFSLATLPETRPDTSCLDIVNFFQEGKSHMVLVSQFPGEPHGALGVVTLEDVIEELIGEEIIDESDVFVDVHKAIRRMTPAPRFRVPKGEVVTDPEPGTSTLQEGEMPEAKDTEEQQMDRHEDGEAGPWARPMQRSSTHPGQIEAPAVPSPRKASLGDDYSKSPRQATFLMRRRSSSGETQQIAIKSNASEMREHLKHLGPRNKATDPKSTNVKSVKIKPGTGSAVATIPENKTLQIDKDSPRTPQSAKASSATGERTGLLQKSHSREASEDTVRDRSYGTLSSPTPSSSHNHGTQTDVTAPPTAPVNGSSTDVANLIPESTTTHTSYKSGVPKLVIDSITHHSPTPSPPSTPKSSSREGSVVGALPVQQDHSRPGSTAMGEAPAVSEGRSRSSSHASAGKRRQTARHGSITENTVDLGGGVKKLVLEMSSSNDEGVVVSPVDGEEGGQSAAGTAAAAAAAGGKENGEGRKKRRKKRAGKKKHGDSSNNKSSRDGGEGAPLLKS